MRNLTLRCTFLRVVRFSRIPLTIPVSPLLSALPSSALAYTLLPFFANWVVGFTIAEGSFFIKANLSAFFETKSTPSTLCRIPYLILLDSYIVDGGYSQFSLASRKDVQSVVHFFSFSGHHPLMGYKATQYGQWIDQLRSSVRYRDLTLPP